MTEGIKVWTAAELIAHEFPDDPHEPLAYYHMPFDWSAVNDLMKRFEAEGINAGSRKRLWHVPSPTGGVLTVEVLLRPRWCSITVDRWYTTPRDTERSAPWFAQVIRPHVEEAFRKASHIGVGMFPSESHTCACAYPLDRRVLLDALDRWVQQELSWGVSRDALR